MENSCVFCISIAQVPIRVKAIHPSMRSYCRQYLIPDNSFAQVNIEITNEDLEIEAGYQRALNAPDYKFDPKILEFDAILRKIADKMLEFDVLLFHASAISVEGKAILFSAPSGTGKSTHTKFWKELYGDKIEIINDDKPLIKFDQYGVSVFGSPWNGKDRLSSLTPAKLDSICFLSRAVENRVVKVSQQEIMQEIFNQIHIPADKTKIPKVLYLLDKVLKNAKLYKIFCTNSIESAKVVSLELLK